MLGVPAIVLSSAHAGTGLLTGFLEICKEADGSSVSGDFTFEVGGRAVVVPVGACSGPLELPAGTATIVESPVEGFTVTDVRTTPADRLVSRDLAAGTARVTIVAGDVSAQTAVTFANRAEFAPLKVCKVAGSGVAVGTDFEFHAGGRPVVVPAGPAPGGYCVVAGSFPVATDVVVSELTPRGVEVSAIAVAPAARQVGAPNVAGGTVVVRIGPGFTEATFTNGVPITPPTTAPVLTTTTTVAPSTTTTVAAVATTTTAPPAQTTTSTPATTTTTSTTVPLTTSTTVPTTSTTVPVTTGTTLPPGTVPVTTSTTAPSSTTTTAVPFTSVVPTSVAPTTTTTTTPTVAVTTTTIGQPLTTTTVPPTTTPPGPTPSVPASTTTVPESPGPPTSAAQPTTFALPPSSATLAVPSPTTQLALTGLPTPLLLLVGGVTIVLGGLLVGLSRIHRRRPVLDDEDFPALSYELDPETPLRPSEPALHRDPWPAATVGCHPGPDVEAGPGEGPREGGPLLGADRLPRRQTGLDPHGLAYGHEHGVVLGEITALAAFRLGREDRLPPILVQAGVDPPEAVPQLLDRRTGRRRRRGSAAARHVWAGNRLDHA